MPGRIEKYFFSCITVSLVPDGTPPNLLKMASRQVYDARSEGERIVALDPGMKSARPLIDVAWHLFSPTSVSVMSSVSLISVRAMADLH